MPAKEEEAGCRPSATRKKDCVQIKGEGEGRTCTTAARVEREEATVKKKGEGAPPSFLPR
jgi:hypothetical protein